MKKFIDGLKALIIRLFKIDVRIPISVKVLNSPIQHAAVADMADMILRKNTNCSKIVLCSNSSEMAPLLKKYIACDMTDTASILYVVLMADDTILEIVGVIGTAFDNILSDLLNEHNQIIVINR